MINFPVGYHLFIQIYSAIPFNGKIANQQLRKYNV